MTDTETVIDPPRLIKVCAWCVPRTRLIELSRESVVSHSLCTACAAKFEARVAA
jgi:hypothetical protein